MGKAQRSKNKKAAEQLGNPSAYVEKNNSGKALKIALAIMALIVAASLIFAFIQSSGVLLRADYGYKSENFEIDGAMMQYLYHSQIYSFLETYYYYIYYYSMMGYNIVDFSQPLENQKFSATAQSLFGTYEGTWFDFFWDKADAQAKQIVVLCEAAKAEGLYDKYAEEAEKTAGESMDSYKEVSKENFSSLSAYFEYLYGEGVKKGDVEKIETLQTIASLYYTDKYNETKDTVFADKEGIEKFYEDNKSNYLMADYIVASFTASLKTNATDEEKEEFLKKVEEAKAHAEAVSKLETIDEINKYLVEYWFEESFVESFKSGMTSAKVEDKDIPTGETLDGIKAIIKAAVMEKAFDENYDSTKDKTFFDPKEYPNIATALDTVTTSFITSAINGMKSIKVEGELYAESTDKDKWLFDEERLEGDVSIFYGTGETTEDKFNEDEDKSYVVNVFRVTDPIHRDETPSVEFGHILLTDQGEYTTEEKQKEKLIALKEAFEKGEKTKEAFEALGKDVTEDSQVTYNDVCPGDMVEEIDTWLFDEARKAGDLEIIKTEDFGYHLVFFVEQSEEQVWFVDAKNDLLIDTFDDWYKALEKKYDSSIEKNADIADKMSSATALLNY